MQLHTLKQRTKSARKVRIGRGGKRGSFSGRGIKGQKARAGRHIRPEMRDIIKKIPKKRGYRHTGPKKTLVVVKSVVVAKYFKPGETVSPKTLFAHRLIRRIGGKLPSVKILGAKAALKGLMITDCTLSADNIKEA
ncbi:MAG: uL15 family ribosomal protein [Patescibacteria group bacterium]